MNKAVLATVLATALTAGIEAGDTKSLVKQLGSSHYPTRGRATKALEANLNEETAQELLRAKIVDLETRRRIDAILAPFHEKQAVERVEKVRKDCKGVLPWIELTHEDCNNFWNVQSYYLQGVPEGTPNSPPDWKAYSKATESLLLNMSRQKTDITPMVEKLKRRHESWVDRHSKNYTPPLLTPWKHDR